MPKENNIPDVSRADSPAGLNILRPLRIIRAHALLFAAALFLSFLVSYDMRINPVPPLLPWFPKVYLFWLMIMIFIKLIVFGFLKQYQGWWRYVSVADLLSIIKGSYVSLLLLAVLWYVLVNIPEVQEILIHPDGIGGQCAPAHPVQVLLLDFGATIVVVCGVRLAIRLYFEESRSEPGVQASRILIVGAGNAGESLLRDIHRLHSNRYTVVGFIDDDRHKLGARIHGIPVLGTADQIREISRQKNIQEIVIAMPSATHKERRRVVELCPGANLRFSIIPDLVSIASGEVRVSQMRDVDIKDLLGREPVTLDLDQIRDFIKNKVVLISGAGGSIGSEMCRQVAQFEPKQLILLEQAENALFFIDNELRKSFPRISIVACIADIAEQSRLHQIFEQYRPAVVIHAAAHKHVPLMEINPGEAIKNNVIGTRNIAEAAHLYGASNFVFISTDKAVNPTSIMGTSKRIAEMVIQCLNRKSKTEFIMVRFGNVLGSNGSVIPLFRQQIAGGGPVTVTHPEMRRYFMTIPEASQLVLQAATMGRGGEVFVLDMGEPVKISDLAKDLITLSGFRPGEDIEIQYTGMRPGEKLFEELRMTGEDMQPTRHPKIGVWLNQPAEEELLNQTIEELLALANDPDNHRKIVQTIKKIVPEYVGDVDSMELHKQHIAQNAHQGRTRNGDV